MPNTQVCLLEPVILVLSSTAQLFFVGIQMTCSVQMVFLNYWNMFSTGLKSTAGKTTWTSFLLRLHSLRNMCIFVKNELVLTHGCSPGTGEIHAKAVWRPQLLLGTTWNAMQVTSMCVHTLGKTDGLLPQERWQMTSGPPGCVNQLVSSALQSMSWTWTWPRKGVMMTLAQRAAGLSNLTCGNSQSIWFRVWTFFRCRPLALSNCAAPSRASNLNGVPSLHTSSPSQAASVQVNSPTSWLLLLQRHKSRVGYFP